ncbi:MAG: hypothetical protein DSZ24_03120 [Thermodesulfatator sp.]|nr:MAG: hypothetical protein DSZ24_03120 [Thermodesulfatator sp.]
MAHPEDQPLDRLLAEYGQVFRVFDDLTLARWMSQTLGQFTGRVLRLSHPLVAAYRLAAQLGLVGWVRNGPEGVELAVWGPEEALRVFSLRLPGELPPLARLQKVSVRELYGEPPQGFEIVETQEGPSRTLAPPDVATCKACLSEILDPEDRRFGYPFTNCTDCGPRYTVIENLPYDRSKTSMRIFEMCPDCLAEYRDPRSRRFHAEPNACPVCGPRIWICDAKGKRLPVSDPWSFIVRTLREGAIWAVKGLGGFHLVCDAQNERVVKELRRRKRRPAKPLAVMVRDLAAARKVAELTPAEEARLLSPEAPIVLAQQRRPFSLAETLAPGLHLVGLMLPYTPLHHLLLRAWPGLALVMTSGNLSDEPLCYRNEEALARLSGVADYFLLHDRPIVSPVDDSVVRMSGDFPILLRRARGFVPGPWPWGPFSKTPSPRCGGKRPWSVPIWGIWKAYPSSGASRRPWPTTAASLTSPWSRWSAISTQTIFPPVWRRRWPGTKGYPSLKSSTIWPTP